MNSTISAILGIAFLIFFHELGHWLVARGLGLKTVVFSIGFGSKATSISLGKFWDTEFRLGLFPFGGFVVIPELQDEEGGRIVLEEHGIDGDAYVKQPVWKRALVIAAGPLANIFLAYGLYVILLIEHRHLLAAQAIVAAFFTTAGATNSVISGLLMMLHLTAVDPSLPAGATDVHGIVGIFQVVHQAAGSSFVIFGQILAYLSLNLAVINLLPLPLFDGGQLLFLAVEKLIGRPVSLELRGYLSLLALVGLILLTGLGLLNDFTKPISL
ncbi:MAG: site-2 protease family protein [Candidatus Melainabacteria bacterium]|nr:site-2 protease family protein [Candidatus Melainabacteria bacterium]